MIYQNGLYLIKLIKSKKDRKIPFHNYLNIYMGVRIRELIQEMTISARREEKKGK